MIKFRIFRPSGGEYRYHNNAFVPGTHSVQVAFSELVARSALETGDIVQMGDTFLLLVRASPPRWTSLPGSRPEVQGLAEEADAAEASNN